MGMLPSGLPDIIADEEDLVRFLTQSSHFNIFQEPPIKPSAFLPSPKDLETSICRHGIDPAERLWQCGVAAANGRKLYGAALFKAKSAKIAALQVGPDEPPDRHAVIKGWPVMDYDADLQKAKRKEKAILLASQSSFIPMFK
jgi:hypothetical protein